MSTCYGPTIKWPSFSVLLAPSISPTPLVLKSQPGSSKILNHQVANLSYNLMSSGLHQDPQPTKILNNPIANNAYISKCPCHQILSRLFQHPRFGKHQVAKNAGMSFFNFYHPISCRPLPDPQSPKIFNNLKASNAAVSLFKSFQSSSRK